MDQTNLLENAAEALRSARNLPIGPERNELRQLAKGLRWMAARAMTAKVESVSEYLGRVKNGQIINSTADAD
jgi:hypothetical protein